MLYEHIATQIEKQIQRGFLTDGEKLPSERELVTVYHVSGNVVREAIGALREKGLVNVRPGKDAYVSELTVRSCSSILNRGTGGQYRCL